MRKKSGVSKNKIKSVKGGGEKSPRDKSTLKKTSGKNHAVRVKESIIEALSHSEAEDGLYFRNFIHLHEEDQRPGVKASQKELLFALNALLEEGRIQVDHDELEVTFRLR